MQTLERSLASFSDQSASVRFHRKDGVWVSVVGALMAGAGGFTAYHVFAIDWSGLALHPLLAGMALAAGVIAGAVLSLFALVGLGLAASGLAALFEREPADTPLPWLPAKPEPERKPRPVPNPPRIELAALDPIELAIFSAPCDPLTPEQATRIARTWSDVAMLMSRRSPDLALALKDSIVMKVYHERVVILVTADFMAGAVLHGEEARELAQELWAICGGPPYTIKFVFGPPRRLR